jgi:hypothetical protein
MKYAFAIIGFLLLILAPMSLAQGDTGGLRALDVAPTTQANMLGTPGTPVVLVDGQNPEGANIAGNHFMSWADAVALGREHYRQSHTIPDLGEAARRYRAEKAGKPIAANLPESTPVARSQDPFIPISMSSPKHSGKHSKHVYPVRRFGRKTA